jgi:hypothetical protein
MMTSEDDKEEIDSDVELRVYNGATLRTVLALRNLFFRTPLQAGVRTALPPACPFSPLRPCLAALAPPPEASWPSRDAKSFLRVKIKWIMKKTHITGSMRRASCTRDTCHGRLTIH